MSHISIFLLTMAKPHEFPDTEPHSLTLAFTWLPHVLCLSFLGAWVPPLTLFLWNRVRAGDVGCQETMSEAIFDSKSLLIYVQFHYTCMNYDFEPKHQGYTMEQIYLNES